MFEGVISSRTKVKILVKLFLNPGTKAYLRELSKEFGVSTNSVRTELNTLKKNSILLSEKDGRNVYYTANTEHPLFPELRSMVRKITGVDALMESVINRLGNLDAVYLAGSYAAGRETGIIDVVLVGEIDRAQLDDICVKTERYIRRKIRPVVLGREELEQVATDGSLGPVMLLWRHGVDCGDCERTQAVGRAGG